MMIGSYAHRAVVSIVGSSIGLVLARTAYLHSSGTVLRLCDDAWSHFRRAYAFVIISGNPHGGEIGRHVIRLPRSKAANC